MRISTSVGALLCLWLVLCPPNALPATTFTIGSYNLENYLDAPSGTRKPKPPEARALVRESIRRLNADILALQEIGTRSALADLASGLATEGQPYPHQVFVEGYDTNIHVAVLSRFPVLENRSHTNDSFLLHGRRFHTSRGFAEIDFKIADRSTLTLFAAHLKSRREVGYADHNELREQEALLLRARIEARLRANPSALLLVAGDLNDVKDSKPIRILVGRGQSGLVDLRPTEAAREPGTRSPATAGGRSVAWTHFYAKEDTYSRVDYLLASRRLAALNRRDGTFVLSLDRWGEASDHRPVVARFALPE